MTQKLFRPLAVWLSLFSFIPLQASAATLEPDTWYMVSVPGDAGQTVAGLFNGQLDGQDYNETWVTFQFDRQTQEYVTPGLNSTLEPGDAFWVLHQESGNVSIDYESDASSVPLNSQVFCSSPIGCYEYDLPVGNDVKWSLIGTPFPEGVKVNDIQLVTSSGPCDSGCTLQQATDAGLASDGLSYYNAASDSYESFSGDQYLEAGDGYWFGTNIPSAQGPAYLLFPTYCTPYS